MKKYLLIIFQIILTAGVLSLQSQPNRCLADDTAAIIISKKTAATDIIKQVRINIHYMLKSDNTGNFRMEDDGDGRTSYDGYKFAFDLTQWMNNNCAFNEKLNIPTGNTISVLDKNYSFILDAVYFVPDNATYYYPLPASTAISISKNMDSVLNIFLTHKDNVFKCSGHALTTDPNSKVKFTENRVYWYVYKGNRATNAPFDWFMHSAGHNTLHELTHLLGLHHTVLHPNSTPCAGIPEDFICLNDPLCEDGCEDTPSAYEVMLSNGCNKHPQCGWLSSNGDPTDIDCSNNLMDYAGTVALSPCQINTIHANLEGGMKTYLLCAAVEEDVSYCDIGYPKVSYYGKEVNIGCTANKATVSNKENLFVYYAENVELLNFEVSSTASIEFILETPCEF